MLFFKYLFLKKYWSSSNSLTFVPFPFFEPSFDWKCYPWHLWTKKLFMWDFFSKKIIIVVFQYLQYHGVLLFIENVRNDFIFEKHFIWDVWLGSEYFSAMKTSIASDFRCSWLALHYMGWLEVKCSVTN